MKKATLALAVLSVLALSACQKEEAAVDTASEKASTAEATAPAAAENAATPAAAETAPYTTDAEKHSYALGASMGLFAQSRLEQQKELAIDYDDEALMAGFKDGLANKTVYTTPELQTLTQAADLVLQTKQSEKAALAAESNIAEGLAYLAENAKKEGVITTASGLQYEVLTAGTGDSPASATSTVKVHYKGTLLNGTEFDSSYKRGEPATFPLNRVIPGWTEGVQLMKEGATYRFTIPSELGYGARSSGKITPNSTLIFDVELIDVIEPAAAQ